MENDDYEVGYGRPPAHSQFKKGQSGNPKGRPRGTRNFKTDLEDELQERVRITEGGKSEEVSKQCAIIKRTVEKALKGDMRAATMVGQWVIQHIGMADDVIDTKGLNQDDKAIIERALNTANGPEPSNPASDDTLNTTINNQD